MKDKNPNLGDKEDPAPQSVEKANRITFMGPSEVNPHHYCCV
jgi:hypothetical protein